MKYVITWATEMVYLDFVRSGNYSFGKYMQNRNGKRILFCRYTEIYLHSPLSPLRIKPHAAHTYEYISCHMPTVHVKHPTGIYNSLMILQNICPTGL